MKILLAGDDFVRNDLLARALSAALPDRPELAALSLPWPDEPFAPVAEVDEASGREEDLIERLGDAEVAVTQMAPFTSRVLDHADRLRLIVCTRGGPVNVNLAAAAERGVAVSATPGRNAVAAAEYTVLLMLAALRRLPEAHAALAGGEWRGRMYGYDECGGEVAGSTVGVVGFGEIGRRVAGLVRALGGRVLVYDPFVGEVGPDVEAVGLADLLGRSDVVTLHARLTPQTRGMLGRAELALVRPGAVLVNTARGALLDHDAALAALESGRLAALALDVFPEEPVPAGHPLLTAPRVVLSPHLAGATRQTAARAARIAAAEVGRYARGEPLAHVVNGVTPRAAR